MVDGGAVMSQLQFLDGSEIARDYTHLSSGRHLNLGRRFDVEIVAVGFAEDLPDGDKERRDDRADDESDRAKYADAAEG
jgi:hypothetical protein